MTVRFQADADLNAAMVAGVLRREPSIDFHRSNPGVFIIAQTVSVRVAIEALLLVWAASESAEWRNLIVELPL